VLKLSAHDLDPLAAFLAASIALDGLAARLSARDAGPCAVVFQQTSEPVSVVTAVRDHPLGSGQTFHYGRRAGAVTDLSSVHKKLDGAARRICDDMQLGVHAIIRLADQPTIPPFF
jgi:hypothetical protein